MENKTAMRSADGVPVFTTSDGSYETEFPEENVIRRAETDETKFKVYGFVGNDADYEEVEWVFKDEEQAIAYATSIYGESDIDNFSRMGEVYEVEVHEVDA